MSYFLFGAVTATKALIMTRARENGVVLKTDLPAIVMEMLQSSDSLERDSTAFLVVHSEADDTSDSLISPFANPVEDICARLEVIQKWLEAVASGRHLAFKVFITEGFDDRWEEAAIDVQSFSKRMCSVLRQNDDWPSVKLRIGKNQH